MSEFESELRKGLSQNGSYKSDLGEKLKKRSAEAFTRRLRWVELTAMFAILILLIVALLELRSFLAAADTKMMILFAIIFLLVMEAANLMKLWYWVVNAKLSILRELKQLRLEIREIAVQVHGPRETVATRADESDRILGDGLPNWARAVYKVALIVVVLLFLFADNGIVDNTMTAVSSASFVAEQSDLWIPTFSDRVVVHSQIALKKWPEGPSGIPIEIPYPSGVVTSATLDGVPAPHHRKGSRKVPGDVDRADILYGEEGSSDRVVVSFEDLEKSGDGWRAKLQSVLPTRSYRLDVILMEGCGLERTDRSIGARFTPFRAAGGGATVSYGSCGLMIRKKVGESIP